MIFDLEQHATAVSYMSRRVYLSEFQSVEFGWFLFVHVEGTKYFNLSFSRDMSTSRVYFFLNGNSKLSKPLYQINIMTLNYRSMLELVCVSNSIHTRARVFLKTHSLFGGIHSFILLPSNLCSYLFHCPRSVSVHFYRNIPTLVCCYKVRTRYDDDITQHLH